MILPFALRRLLHRHFCRIQHIFNKDPVPRGGIADEDVSDRAHKVPILNNGAAAQVCGV